MYKKYVRLRDSLGVTDYRVASDTGIPKSTFSDWKSGRSVPKINKLQKIATYFGVVIEALLEDEENPVSGSVRDGK